MATRRKEVEPEKPRRSPATTPEAQENRLIGLAVDLAERQLKEGTASAQVQTHFLKLASSREKLEQTRLEEEILHLKAKTENMASAARIEELYDAAISAMRSYAGDTPLSKMEDDDEFAD